MKVIPLEAEGLAPLSANGIRIKVPDVIPEPGGGCRRSLCKRLRQQHLGDGIRNLPPRSEHFWRQASMSQESCRQFRQYMV